MTFLKTWQGRVALAVFGSVSLLAGAFLFQALGYPPCKMCLWQRWPHAAAIAIGALTLVLGRRILAWLGALAAAVTSGIGLYHTGVERGWWEGPSSCTGTGSLDPTDLLNFDAPPLILCDQVSWEFLTLSMASWNTLASAGIAVLWIVAARTKA